MIAFFWKAFRALVRIGSKRINHAAGSVMAWVQLSTTVGNTEVVGRAESYTARHCKAKSVKNALFPG